jgi:hypothetical protein
MTANEQNITPGFYWANLAAYRLEETLSTGLPIRFAQRMADNKKLALACARRNLLAFFSGNVVDTEIQAAAASNYDPNFIGNPILLHQLNQDDDDTNQEFDDEEVMDGCRRPDPAVAPSYLQARQDMANELRSFKLAHLGVISTETDDALVNGLLRMRSKLAAVRVGAQVIVNVPSRVGLLGIATVVREAGINCECIGLPGFRTTVGIKWTFGPFIAGDDILGVKSQEIRAITQSIGLNIDSPIQAVTFSQFSHIAKLFV